MNINDLLVLNVNEHTEKKNGLTYLSWAWAWAEALKADPKATFKVEMQEHGGPLMPIGETFMVWVTVTMFDKPMTCMLPVLDYRNKPIFNPNSFDVNTSIMRCLVKAIAMHGLGLYIYAGEDIPEEDAKPVKEETKPQVKEEVKPEVKRTVPAKIEGHEMGWQIKLTMPQDDSNEWVDLLKTSTRILFDTAKGQKDITDIFKVNRNIYDHLKSINPEEHKSLMAEFAKAKSLFKE